MLMSNQTPKVSKIICKIFKALRSVFLERIGYEMAERISQAASKFGNSDGLKWRFDVNFARCLGINAISSRLYNEILDLC